MTPHFSAFSFVDRIRALDATQVRGSFAVPAGLTAFSPCLVAEAVGQLAAWAAMAGTEFTRRPVAALAAEVDVAAAVLPGAHLDLAVDIESCDGDVFVYDGWAHCADTRVIELHRCVGPLLPLEEFDDPNAVRAHFNILCGTGASGGRFRGIAAHEVVMIEHTQGVGARAVLHVPPAAPFFDDHFPRRRVFPATLLVDAAIELAVAVVGRAAHVQRIEDVKLRAFIAPGQRINFETTIVKKAAAATTLALVARVDGKRVATARLTLSTRSE